MTRLFFHGSSQYFLGQSTGRKMNFWDFSRPFFDWKLRGKAFDGFSLFPNYFGDGGAENKPSEGEQKKSEKKLFSVSRLAAAAAKKKSLSKKKFGSL